MGRGKRHDGRNQLALSDGLRSRPVPTLASVATAAVAASSRPFSFNLPTESVYLRIEEIVGASYGSLADLTAYYGADLAPLAKDLRRFVEEWVTPLDGLPNELSEDLMAMALDSVDWLRLAEKLTEDVETEAAVIGDAG